MMRKRLADVDRQQRIVSVLEADYRSVVDHRARVLAASVLKDEQIHRLTKERVTLMAEITRLQSEKVALLVIVEDLQCRDALAQYPCATQH